MRIPNDIDLFTTAHLSVQFQIPFRVMQAALDVIGAKPALSLNDIQYYALSDSRVELIQAYLDTRRHNNELNAGAKWTADIPIPRGYQKANP